MWCNAWYVSLQGNLPTSAKQLPGPDAENNASSTCILPLCTAHVKHVFARLRSSKCNHAYVHFLNMTANLGTMVYLSGGIVSISAGDVRAAHARHCHYTRVAAANQLLDAQVDSLARWVQFVLLPSATVRPACCAAAGETVPVTNAVS